MFVCPHCIEMCPLMGSLPTDGLGPLGALVPQPPRPRGMPRRLPVHLLMHFRELFLIPFVRVCELTWERLLSLSCIGRKNLSQWLVSLPNSRTVLHGKSVR